MTKCRFYAWIIFVNEIRVRGMETSDTPQSKKSKNNFSLCIICQEESLLLDSIKKLSSFGNQKYYRIQNRLNVDNPDEFVSMGVTWH